MSQYWNPLVQTLDPYVPGEQPKDQRYIKLNTNECPYPPSPLVLAAIQAELTEKLRLYPDPHAEQLKTAIADYYQLEPKQVFVGNGSDEVLAHVFHGLFKADKPLLFPDISYSFYPVYANLYQLTVKQMPLTDDLSLDLSAYQQPNAGIIFPNPNAPTGKAIPLASIEQCLQANRDSVVVVDEAYVDFGAQTAIPLIKDYPNLLVVQTLSKSRSLAGLRVGFALGQADLIEGLERIKDSFNSYPLDRLAIAGASAAIKDQAYFAQICQKVIQTREQTVLALNKLGFEVIPSSANFVFARHPRANAEDLYHSLKQQGVLVRYFKKPRLSEYLRISIGTDVEMQVLLEKLQTLLAQ